MGEYIPSSHQERAQMLEALGLEHFDALYRTVPAGIKLNALNIPKGQSELGVRRMMEGYAAENTLFSAIFRGAGAYHHYIPSIVKTVTANEAMLTAYTPYQPEISQGVLQSIFEYQTLICELTGMEASNASVYDGATAAAEAVCMCRDKRRSTALVASTAHPMSVQTIQTYSDAANAPVQSIPERMGTLNLDALSALLDGGDAACVYVQQPNYYGLFEDMEQIERLAHAAGAKLIMAANPIALSIIQTPGEIGADIAVGEGQPLGIPLGFGGPFLGFMASTNALLRKLPGRIVGETTDLEGKRAFVLTLQAREQHIRREKALSNICSNQALCAMTASAYAAAMGEAGLREVAHQCHSKAAYLMACLCAIPGFERVHSGEFFHEFVTHCHANAEALTEALARRGFLAGLPIGEHKILWCATEMNTKAQMDALIDAIREVTCA